MRSLAKVLEAVQRLVEPRDEDSEERVAAADKPPDLARALHLLDVKSGSAAYAVAAPDPKVVINTLSSVGRSIQTPKTVDWADSTLSSLRDLSEVARTIGCNIEFCQANGSQRHSRVLARITPQTYEDVSVCAFIRGPTSVYARIERVGGATAMRCGIRLPGSPQKMVICRVASADLVRRLGKYLYQHVLLSGRATWLRHDWRLKGLVIESFEPPKTGSILNALTATHDAGGRAWDEIEDPDALIAEMRGL
jgi:hypothetical protein